MDKRRISFGFEPFVLIILAAAVIAYGLSIFGVRVPDAMSFHPAVAATLMVFAGTLLAQSLIPERKQSLRFKVISWVVALLSLFCGVIAITIVE
jgi:hypothetical protein